MAKVDSESKDIGLARELGRKAIHLGALVMPDKLPISRIEELMNEKGSITDEATLSTLRQHAADFLEF